jgi:Flp pilus assembly CpaF family ATPase
VLAACVHARLSIVFAGPPGSGKTTLLSCTTAELDPALRVVVAEEVFEADIPVPNVAQMQTRAARTDRPAFDLRRLVAGFLRMAPDVAVVVGKAAARRAQYAGEREHRRGRALHPHTGRPPRVIEVAMVEDLAGGVEATQFTIAEVSVTIRRSSAPTVRRADTSLPWLTASLHRRSSSPVARTPSSHP